jgi:hypothetical protein
MLLLWWWWPHHHQGGLRRGGLSILDRSQQTLLRSAACLLGLAASC